MPFFSVGYAEKQRIEVTLLSSPTGAGEWIEARVRAEIDSFIGENQISLTVGIMVSFKEQLEPL